MTDLKHLSDIRLRAAQCLYQTWLELGEIQPLLGDDVALELIVLAMRGNCSSYFRRTTGRRIETVRTIFELSVDAEVRDAVPVVFGTRHEK